MNIVDAVEKGDLRSLRRLVEGGADVNAMHGAWTALMLAAANRNIRSYSLFTSKRSEYGDQIRR